MVSGIKDEFLERVFVRDVTTPVLVYEPGVHFNA
jgi:hypothetical protein